MKQLFTKSSLFLLGLLTTTSFIVAPVYAQNDAKEETTVEVSQEDKSEFQTILETALKDFEEKYPEVKISGLKVKIQKDDIIEVEIEGFDNDSDYEVTYNSKEQQFTKEEKDELDSDDEYIELALDKLKTLDEITEIANQKTNLSNIESWKLSADDDHNNQPVWEVEYDDEKEKDDVELKIDAQSGEILKVEGLES
ncbi:PepSY domain-containing protein [Falseniella ignava]|uniref:PepSY domain-containing protein n=1 Tax=Falseniella ignava CCUG 37419 TaxID=883112 RepID=K1MKP1_9LACT|nr:PepSY domain-containing protein [Falseniella ignava]EKB56529.1 hypothetical protein HMPREF9707_00887 [Falseniella ignava CCUG 37419]